MMNFWPSRVLIFISAAVSVPSFTPRSTVISTRTWSPSSSTSRTLPTRTPATRTSSFGFTPPASVNCAEIVLPPPISGRSWARNAASIISPSAVSPTTPTVTGFCSRKGFTRHLAEFTSWLTGIRVPTGSVTLPSKLHR